MTLPGGAALAENNYGRQIKPWTTYTACLAVGICPPWQMYEVSPDWMMCQAWNIYSFGYPIVRQFFGVQPDPQQIKLLLIWPFRQIGPTPTKGHCHW